MMPIVRAAAWLVAHAGRLIVAGVFLSAGVLKSFDPEGFAVEVSQYGIIGGWAAQVAAYALIPIEIALGVALLLNWRPRVTLAAAAGLLLFFMGAIVFALATGQNLEGCGCFGRAMPRTPQQTLLEDGLLVALAGLAWGVLGRGAAEARGRWKTALVAGTVAASAAFALASPHLPIDDAVTELKPGVSWNDLDVALAEVDLSEGTHLVALLGMKDERSAQALPQLNRLAEEGEPLVGLYGEEESAYNEFLWTRAPAFPLYNVSPSDMRRLHRRLPRFFAVTGGRVAATWDSPPSPESVRAAVGGSREAS
jgi:hypothetical protein